MRALAIRLGMGLVACITASAGNAPAEPKPHTITARELEQGSGMIVGHLGLPLVNAVEIEATVIEDYSIYDHKVPTGEYLLRVEKVAGVNLKEPIDMAFRVRASSNAAVAETSSALDKRLKILQSRTLDPSWEPTTNPDGTRFSLKIRTAQEAEAYKARYVGSRHKLVVYELVRVDGAPLNLPNDVEGWSTGVDGHHSQIFSLVVVGERKL